LLPQKKPADAGLKYVLLRCILSVRRNAGFAQLIHALLFNLKGKFLIVDGVNFIILGYAVVKDRVGIHDPVVNPVFQQNRIDLILAHDFVDFYAILL
jgi:hypothetical protein